MEDWAVGQRCASKGEPSLGLGVIKSLTGRQIHVVFPSGEIERVYSKKNAPLQRVSFSIGEMVKDRRGHAFMVREVKEQNGILFYLGDDDLLPETELNDAIIYSRPDQKLLAGQINKPKEFDLRCQAWNLKHRILASPVRGFVGPRIELIPHQLYIAETVSERATPRVLLSDEVGLGKTIEAALIFHRLYITGKVKRVLCLVPDALVHQWLSELFRKFNVLFTVMNPDHVEGMAESEPDANPYELHQCVIQSIDSLVEDPDLAAHLLRAEWDLVIVDEAHQLEWSPEDASPQYAVVEALAQLCRGLLLLTATPRQLGLESHFGRLKLIDPQRFESFERFEQEAEGYADLALLIDHLQAGKASGEALKEIVAELFPEDAALMEMVEAGVDQTGIDSFINAIIDRHGTGRIVFRNRRSVLSGFPKRIVHPVPLDAPTVYRNFLDQAIQMAETLADGQNLISGAPSFKPQSSGLKEIERLAKKAWPQDPRIDWLVKTLRDYPEEKFLLITAEKTVVLALQERLSHAKDIELAVFHEDLSAQDRDRQAAYFSQDAGARVLLCSEIGSEGRNFQFAHHLVLFDLPLNPALLEQRIGRLDRIGQHEDIHIHIPYICSSPHESLYRWYQDGLNAFEDQLAGGDYIFEHLFEHLPLLFSPEGSEALDEFLTESRTQVEETLKIIEEGRDKLLEQNSFRRERADALVHNIELADDNPEVHEFMDRLLDMFGVQVDDHDGSNIQFISPSSHMFVESFPGLPEEGMLATYDRDLAVSREDIAFLSCDHPMVTGAIDLMLQLDRGTTSFSVWQGAPNPGLLAQCLFVFEARGTNDHSLEGILPPTPFLVAVDQTQSIRDDLLEQLDPVKLEKGPITKLQQLRGALTDILDKLLPIAEKRARKLGEKSLNAAKREANDVLAAELARLEALRAINPGVREEEIEAIKARRKLVREHLSSSALRLDAIRLVMMIP